MHALSAFHQIRLSDSLGRACGVVEATPARGLLGRHSTPGPASWGVKDSNCPSKGHCTAHCTAAGRLVAPVPAAGGGLPGQGPEGLLHPGVAEVERRVLHELRQWLAEVHVVQDGLQVCVEALLKQQLGVVEHLVLPVLCFGNPARDGIGRGLNSGCFALADRGVCFCFVLFFLRV